MVLSNSGGRVGNLYAVGLRDFPKICRPWLIFLAAKSPIKPIARGILSSEFYNTLDPLYPGSIPCRSEAASVIKRFEV
ncbi:hypothetical protein SUGI_0446990 [Cryptomeria japonica]|nr:hypothetical protein SUGI_0446990 [Cryptomeria japonica]